VKVGVLLAGCGMYDGSEPVETAAALIALDRSGAQAVCVAPGIDQLHTVDHLTGEEAAGPPRSVLGESARLARGKVRSLSGFWGGDLQGLIIPGGYGAAKNLMTGFMEPGARRDVLPEVRALLDDLAGRRRPVGAVSLGRAVLRAYLGEDLSDDDLALPPDEVVVDEERRILFTPGFLTATRPSEAARGIEAMVGRLLRMAAAGLPVVG
jgi:enhancing lycopene biosynthesis protein 2